MTRDIERHAVIAHALVTLLTDPDHRTGDPQVQAGFDAVLDALEEGVGGTGMPEAPAQLAMLAAARRAGADVFAAGNDEDRGAAMATLAEGFDDFLGSIPGLAASSTTPVEAP